MNNTTKNKFESNFKKRFHGAVLSSFADVSNCAKFEFKVKTGVYADGTSWVARRCYVSIEELGITGYVQKDNRTYCDAFGNKSGWSFRSSNNTAYNEMLFTVQHKY